MNSALYVDCTDSVTNSVLYVDKAGYGLNGEIVPAKLLLLVAKQTLPIEKNSEFGQLVVAEDLSSTNLFIRPYFCQ